MFETSAISFQGFVNTLEAPRIFPLSLEYYRSSLPSTFTMSLLILHRRVGARHKRLQTWQVLFESGIEEL